MFTCNGNSSVEQYDRCGNFVQFGQFLEALGHFFLFFYLLLGAFGANFSFSGGNFWVMLIY